MQWSRNKRGKTKVPNWNLKVLSAVEIVARLKQLENMKCCNYLGMMITNDARCTREIK
jgi:hypothetical protein